MAGRIVDLFDTAGPETSDSPGPGAYGLPTDPRLPNAPAYTLAPRVAVPEAGVVCVAVVGAFYIILD